MRLRRSFSLDFVNDDTSTVFLGEGGDQHDNNHPHHGHVSIHSSSIHSSSIHSSSIHSSGSTSAPGVSSTTTVSSNTTENVSHSSPSHDSSKGLSPFSIHSGPTMTIHSSPHSSSGHGHSSHHHSNVLHQSGLVSPWHENSPDIDDALAADFDGSLSGLGMEVGSSPYNMSDALMALPSLKPDQYHHRHHLLHHHASHGHHPVNGHHRETTSNHSHHIPSNYHHGSHHEGSSSHGGHHSSSMTSDQDARPVAIVHGKKNRLPFGHDEDQGPISSGIKRVCISSDRDSSHNEASNSSRFSALHISNSSHNSNSSHHSIIVNNHGNQEANHRGVHSRESSLDSMTDGVVCPVQNCDHSLSKCGKYSGSAPDLRANQHPSHPKGHDKQNNNTIGNNYHSNESSPSPLLSQMLSTHILNQHNSTHHSTHTDYPLPLDSKHNHLTGSSSLRRGSSLSDISFEYTLCAATSAATKIHEETMTYLNQGQSYEIKLRRIPIVSSEQTRYKRVKSVIRVGFHERRLQFMESELIDQWRDQRHSERILEVDIPLSYGITEVMNDPLDINKCSFLWDTSKETGIFIKVNCISTEFTPKKHGGEKGVPFRVIIETHGIFTAETPSLLHAASSQVKVFKPKGADRKHKTDREKLSKKSQSSGELDKYRPSYDHTVFTEIPLDQFYSSSFPDVGLNRSSTPVKRSSSPAAAVVSPERKFFALSQGSQSSNGSKTEGGPLDFTNSQSRSIIRSLTSSIASTSLSSEDIKSGLISSLTRRATISPHSPSSSNHSHNNLIPIAPDSIETPSVKMSNFLEDSNPSQVTQFLLFNRFDRHIKTFNNYSGSDLLRLTRSDLIHLCNSDSDGIRLYNLLHHHPRRHPKCVIYVTFASKTEEEPEFSAIYLENLTEKELRSKLGNILTEDERSSQGNTTVSAPNSISRIKMKGPLGIPISVTDDVVHNIQSESMFTLAFEKDGNNNCFRAILKTFSIQHHT